MAGRGGLGGVEGAQPSRNDFNGSPGLPDAGSEDGTATSEAGHRVANDGKYDHVIGTRPRVTIDASHPLAPEEKTPFTPRGNEPLAPNTAYRVYDRTGRDRGLFLTDRDGNIGEIHAQSGRKQPQKRHLRRVEWGFIPDLRKPMPNMTYHVDGRFTYRTDEYGRVVSATGTLELDGSDKNRRGPDQTPIGRDGEREYREINRLTLEEYERKFGREPTPDEVLLFRDVRFQGGHLFGTEFGGPGESVNMVPMLEMLNQNKALGGAVFDNWRLLEKHWEGLLQQRSAPKVDVSIKLEYDPHDPGSTTPKYIRVGYSVNGTLAAKYRYRNIPPRKLI